MGIKHQVNRWKHDRPPSLQQFMASFPDDGACAEWLATPLAERLGLLGLPREKWLETGGEALDMGMRRVRQTSFGDGRDHHARHAFALAETAVMGNGNGKFRP